MTSSSKSILRFRFDADEARSFFSDVGGLELSRRDVHALTASTDGWVAALQLASLSLRGDDDAASLLGRLSGRSDVIGEFLAENVLDTLEPEILDFLLLTSITERTCAGLASALANVTRGQAMLEEVERRGLFLQHIDDDRNWFRYHHMFAEFLRRRLERDRPDRSNSFTAPRRRGSPNMATSTMLSTTRWPLGIPPWRSTSSSKTRQLARAGQDDDAARDQESCRRSWWFRGRRSNSSSPGRIFCCNVRRPPLPRWIA